VDSYKSWLTTGYSIYLLGRQALLNLQGGNAYLLDKTIALFPSLIIKIQLKPAATPTTWDP
jgi:hypothetical protein